MACRRKPKSLKRRSAPDTNAVFLNLPFERNYEPIFVGFVVGLVTLGLVPRSVIELDEDGDGRMGRLFRLMQQCGASIHDLSYRGPEYRYNMPFELGVAYAITRYETGRTLLICEAAKRDLLKTLSDLRGFDPKTHGMDGKKALALIYDNFLSPSLSDPEALGLRIYKDVMANLPKFRKGHKDIFNKRSFLLLIYVVSMLTKPYDSRPET
jgi:hypothetical protein